MVTARGGWFVAGKFDQYRRDLDGRRGRAGDPRAGPAAAGRAGGGWPQLRARLLDGAGPQRRPGRRGAAGVRDAAGGAAPELPAGDRARSRRGCIQVGLDLLRAVASPAAAGGDGRSTTCSGPAPTPIGFVDAVLTDERPDGPAAGRRLPRRRGRRRPSAVGHAGALGAAGRRAAAAAAGQPAAGRPGRPARRDAAAAAGRGPRELAEAIGARTGGNPYDTVELVNALRRDGALVPGPARLALGRRRPSAATSAGATWSTCWPPGSTRLPPDGRRAAGGDGLPRRRGRARPAAGRHRPARRRGRASGSRRRWRTACW